MLSYAGQNLRLSQKSTDEVQYQLTIYQFAVLSFTQYIKLCTNSNCKLCNPANYFA